MTKYIALLRGITPSKPNMSNSKLRIVFEELGFDSVSSVISSGNIIFETSQTDIPTLESTIEQALYAKLNLVSTTIIRRYEDLQHLVNTRPFAGRTHSESSYLTVTFLKTVPTSKLVFPESYPIITVSDFEVCSAVDTLAKEHDPILWLERHYGRDITTRTWNTVERIVKKMS